MSSAALVSRHPPAYLRLLRARGLGARAARARTTADGGDEAEDAECAPALAVLRRCQAMLAEDGVCRAMRGSALDELRAVPRAPWPIRAPDAPERAPAVARPCDALCAWLIAHQPAHLFAACIGCDDAWLVDAAYVALARRCGLAVRAPCAQASAWATRAVGGELRLGLHLVRGLARADAEAVVRERARGRFSGVRQLKARCRLAPATLRALDAAGALDAVAPAVNARQRALLVERACMEPDAFIANPSAGGERLLSELALEERDPPVPPLRVPDPAATRARRWRALGCLDESLARWRAAPHAPRLRDLHGLAPGAAVALVVRRASRQIGRCVALEDEDGLAASWWDPRLLAQRAELLAAEPFLALGRMVAARGGRALTIEDARPLP